MLHRNPIPWQRALAEAVQDPRELLALLELPSDLLPGVQAANQSFRLRVPRGYINRMRKGDPDDPLLRQVLPLAAETLAATPGFHTDPVGDLESMPVPGLLHKYAGRVLLVTTSACGIHCRYCFRRHFPYGEAHAGGEDWREALTYIAARDDIHEVILSGGDPLTLSDQRLAVLAHKLATIPHVRRLRIHTRMPVILPERVDAALLNWLKTSRLQTVIVIHANHAREIDEAVHRSLHRMADSGVVLLNQAVLLKGVNNSAEAQQALCERLFAARVMPYYLHLLDRVQGAAHFESDEQQARILMDTLRASLPGYLVPRLVREVEGAPSKLPFP